MDSDAITLSSLGISESTSSDLSPEQAGRVAATLDVDASSEQGDDMPMPWHWAYFPSSVSTVELRMDGHPAAPMSDMSLPPNRIFAGGRLRIDRCLRVGHPAQRHARLVGATPKLGRSGEFLLATVEYQYIQDDAVCITEQQDLVYRHSVKTSSATGPPAHSPTSGTVGRTVIPSRELLFRYSAVTFNTHRIHYDRDYAVNTENYPDLVVQGPLVATWLAGLAAELLSRPPLTFAFRATAPTFVAQPIRLTAATAQAGAIELSAITASNAVTMTATARL